jgi:hypothetical protein
MHAKRNIKTFEPDLDVARMLERAEAGGIKLKFICNSALRKYLTSAGYARKKDLAEKEAA